MRTTSHLWVIGQRVGLVLTLSLLGALVLWPRPALHVLWDMVIPLLPAAFLVNPLLWRNVCPLATLNSLTGGVGQRSLGGRSARVAWTVGIVLLAVMVPARRFLFNTNGPALAVTIGVVALLALVAGLFYSRRAGFCSGVCPVLPVEKLYGQSPLLQMGNPRCADCSLCAPVGCIDLASTKTVAQTIGPARKSRAWVTTPIGAFAASFPGFIAGYFTLDDGAFSTAGATYAHVALYALVSYALVAAFSFAIKSASRALLMVLGATSFALYYWYVAPTLGAAYGAPRAGTTIVRALAATLLAIWLWQGWRRSDIGPARQSA